MKSHIKKFTAFVNEESGYYPAGTENDPSAPWNQSDDGDIVRDNDWIDNHPQKSLFNCLLVVDEFAILKHKENGELYIAYIDGDDAEEYRPKSEYRSYIGRDEDGDPDYEVESETLPMDELGAEAFATDNIENAGSGLEDWENGAPVSKIDQDLRADLIGMYAKDYEKGGPRQKKALAMLKVLDSPLH